MLWFLLCLVFGAAVSPLVYRGMGNYTGLLLSLLPLGILASAARSWSAIAAGEGWRETYVWAPSLGVQASLRMDALALVFIALICGIGAAVLVYAGRYMRGEQRMGLFYGYLMFFMASMLGLVLADNVLLVFVFWELTSISSFLLIGWNHQSEGARAAARTSLIVTGGGGMMLLGGLVLLSMIGGSDSIAGLSAEAVRGDPLYLPTLILVLGGALTKSAQFPFHFWLPGAMAAPTPVSAYLHSATMVKAGVYLLARLNPTLGGTDAWYWLLTSFGAVTMLVGGFIAVTQTDLKRILAYSTVSVLGTLVLLIGVGTEAAIGAAVVYLVAHSLYKGALFLVAGIVDHETGTRDITRLRGLGRPMPLTAVAVGIAAASSAGVPPLLGFVSKELLYEAARPEQWSSALAFVASMGASVLLVVVAFMVGYRPFVGGQVIAPRQPHEAPLAMLVGPLVLAAMTLVLGMMPGVADEVLGRAAGAVYGQEVALHLKLWHGWNLVLALSIATIVAGAGLYGTGAFDRWIAGAEDRRRLEAQRVYDAGYAGVMRFAERVSGAVQNGYLRNYVLVVVITLLALLAPSMFAGQQWLNVALSEVYLHDVILGISILVAAIAVTLVNSRLAVAAILGVIGVTVMLVYVVFGALDLAVTQIMVETLTLIMLVLVLFHLPRFRYRSKRWVYVRDATVSIAFGGMIALLVLKAYALHGSPELARFYAENSYSQAHGRNVVNVILVDFRATDTMGEVTVLATAAVGVFALLRLGGGRRRGGGAMISVVLRSATPVLMLLLLVVGIYALFRGHHESGGGFIGGLLAAAAFSLHALAHDVRATRRLLGVAPQTIMAVGLATMATAGIIGLMLGGPFLEAQWVDAPLPGLRTAHLGTPLLFDVGVFAVVFGMVLTMVLTAAEE